MRESIAALRLVRFGVIEICAGVFEAAYGQPSRGGERAARVFADGRYGVCGGVSMRDIAQKNNALAEELTETVRTLAKSGEKFERVVGSRSTV
jgi:hypothetical protein